MIRRLLAPPSLPLAIGFSLAIGTIVPSIYERRPRNAILEWIAIGSVIVAIAIWGTLRAKDETHDRREPLMQFSLRSILIGTAIVAIVAASARTGNQQIVSVVVVAVALSTAAWSIREQRVIRNCLLCLLAVLFLPFAWIAAYSRPIGRISNLVDALPIGPGIIPSLLTRSFVDLDHDQVTCLAGLFVVTEILIGFIVFKRSTAWANAYLLVILLISAASSFALFVGTRV